MKIDFEIEEMVSQDEYGVVFLARNKESGEPLSVRRVFPNGPDGPGIEGDDKRLFLATMSRLVTLRHHLLRPILDGGVDPVDSMPYVVMPVMAGSVLSEELATGPADITVTKTLLDEALEASEILSGLLGEESVWVETSPNSILIGDPDQGRAFFFRISIGKWITHREDRQNFASLADLAETMMGWQPEDVTPEAAGNLGDWVMHVRNGGFTTLGEARRALRQVGRVQKKVTARAATFKPGGAAQSSAPEPKGPAVYSPKGLVGAPVAATPTTSATPTAQGGPRAATKGPGRPPGPGAAAGAAASSAPRTYVAPPAKPKSGAKMWIMAGVVMAITAVLAVLLIQKLKSQKQQASGPENKTNEQIIKENPEAAKLKELMQGGKKDSPKK